MKCEKCGYKIKKSFKVCPHCGENIILIENVKAKTKVKLKFILPIFIITIVLIIGVYYFFFTGPSVKTNRQSVLKINVYDEGDNIIQTGSGFIVFDEDILITNAHVIEGGIRAEAVSESDERVYIQGAIYYSTKKDIAILKLNKQNKIKSLKISLNYDIGEEVVAIGSPLGIKNSVSDGMISNIIDENGQKMIQHTAPISPGSSGGVLFNSKGKVIGMNTASYTDGQNMNLAIPIETISKIYKKYKDNDVKNIKFIQKENESDVKSNLFDSEAGKSILNITMELTNGDFNTRNKISDFKSIPVLEKIYEQKNNIENAYIFWGSDDREKDIESPLNEFIIIEVTDMNSDIKESLRKIFVERKEMEYEFATADDVDRDFEYSEEYITAIENATIGFNGKYAYFIITKDEQYKEKIEKLIQQLP